MKTFWFMIGGSAVLTVALVFVGMYRISKLDSTTQPQNAPQVQKQHINESIPAKENPGRLVSELPKPAPVAKPSVAAFKPGTVMANKAQRRKLTGWYPGNATGATGPELPNWTTV